ncbi:unnamed protein product [Brassicogethes aeneus]|uniref:Nucleoporin p58/p45 n=1 Tax=Brassicogethes aeneus TaxID=1431903 RepID=A0A9P0BDI5_BRAAE|nr:unnamed protein product [Brassicogethes aeneus]
MAFNFGTPQGAPPAFGAQTSTFGQPQQTQQTPQFGAQSGGFSFGANTAQPQAQAPSLFNTPTQQTQAPQSTGFSFGASTGPAPSFGALTQQAGAPSFGAQPTLGAPQQQQPAAPGFGAAPSYGQATAGAPQYGAQTTVPTTNPPSFGAATSGFGAATSAAPSFGAPSTGAPSLFGTPTSKPGGLFGAQPAPAATTSTQSTGFSFGAPNAALPKASVAPTLQTSQPATLLSFGTPASTATATLSFPATSAAAPLGGPSFGAQAATSAPQGLSFGTSSASSANTLNFTATTTPASTGIFSLGGLGGTTAAISTVATSAVSTPVVGLGGVAASQSKTGAKANAQKEISPKDQPLPNEIQQTVENFKNVVKDQKSHSSDISRCSVRDYRKVEQEIDLLNNLISEVETQLQKNRHLTEKLKYDTAKSFQNVEMAQRTQDTPPGLQYENMAPLKFFLELADSFEREMLTIKFQIESADKFVKNYNNPNQITHQDIALGMKRLHETFVALAGRLQAVHSQVETQKETYVNLRKHLYNDSTNPFDKLSASNSYEERLKKSLAHSPPRFATGPTPFSNLSLGGNGITAMAAQKHSQNASMMPTQPPAFPSTSFGQPIGGTQPSNTSLFGSVTNQSSFGFNSSFQLQKPPSGNKRGAQ